MSTESKSPTEYYRCVFRGTTSDNVPYQRVYGTTDREVALGFNAILSRGKSARLTREALDDLIKTEFPHLEFIEEQVGNDIQPVRDIPDAFPVGEGVWDDTNRVQLLKRTLMDTLVNVRQSGRGAGNEISSNLPTYYFAATTDSLFLKFAAVCGTGISAALIYRRQRHMDEFDRALKIWVRFTNNTKIAPERALDILEQDMLDEGLLFSGRPERPMSEFDADEFKTLAQRKKLWYDSNDIVEHLSNEGKLSGIQKIVKFSRQSADASMAFSRLVSATVSSLPENIRHQLEDLGTNWYKQSTRDGIAAGFKYSYNTLIDFKLTNNRSRGHLRIRHSDPELTEISIEDNQIIQDTVDPDLVRQVRVTRQDFRQQVLDGKIMVGAFALESMFYASHWAELISNGIELAKPFSDSAAAHGGDIGATLAHAGVALYSILMVKGAYAEIGRNVRGTYNAAHSRRAEMLDLYPRIQGEYDAHQSRVNGETDDISPST